MSNVPEPRSPTSPSRVLPGRSLTYEGCGGDQSPAPQSARVSEGMDSPACIAEAAFPAEPASTEDDAGNVEDMHDEEHADNANAEARTEHAALADGDLVRRKADEAEVELAFAKPLAENESIRDEVEEGDPLAKLAEDERDTLSQEEDKEKNQISSEVEEVLAGKDGRVQRELAEPEEGLKVALDAEGVAHAISEDKQDQAIAALSRGAQDGTLLTALDKTGSEVDGEDACCQAIAALARRAQDGTLLTALEKTGSKVDGEDAVADDGKEEDGAASEGGSGISVGGACDMARAALIGGASDGSLLAALGNERANADRVGHETVDAPDGDEKDCAASRPGSGSSSGSACDMARAALIGGASDGGLLAALESEKPKVESVDGEEPDLTNEKDEDAASGVVSGSSVGSTCDMARAALIAGASDGSLLAALANERADADRAGDETLEATDGDEDDCAASGADSSSSFGSACNMARAALIRGSLPAALAEERPEGTASATFEASGGESGSGEFDFDDGALEGGVFETVRDGLLSGASDGSSAAALTNQRVVSIVQAGESGLCTSLAANVAQSIPQKVVEVRRSPPKSLPPVLISSVTDIPGVKSPEEVRKIDEFRESRQRKLNRVANRPSWGVPRHPVREQRGDWNLRTGIVYTNDKLNPNSRSYFDRWLERPGPNERMGTLVPSWRLDPHGSKHHEQLPEPASSSSSPPADSNRQAKTAPFFVVKHPQPEPAPAPLDGSEPQFAESAPRQSEELRELRSLQDFPGHFPGQPRGDLIPSAEALADQESVAKTGCTSHWNARHHVVWCNDRFVTPTVEHTPKTPVAVRSYFDRRREPRHDGSVTSCFPKWKLNISEDDGTNLEAIDQGSGSTGVIGDLNELGGSLRRSKSSIILGKIIGNDSRGLEHTNSVGGCSTRPELEATIQFEGTWERRHHLTFQNEEVNPIWRSYFDRHRGPVDPTQPNKRWKATWVLDEREASSLEDTETPPSALPNATASRDLLIGTWNQRHSHTYPNEAVSAGLRSYFDRARDAPQEAGSKLREKLRDDQKLEVTWKLPPSETNNSRIRQEAGSKRREKLRDDKKLLVTPPSETNSSRIRASRVQVTRCASLPNLASAKKGRNHRPAWFSSHDVIF